MLANKASAVLLKLIKELKEKGSLCGEQHVQKTMYILQEVEGVDSGFDFMIYKHGPYSFDLRDTLASLRANGVVDLIPQLYPNGPRLDLTKEGEAFLERLSPQLETDIPKIEYIANLFSKKLVAELERLGTALYISRALGDQKNKNIETLAKEINRLRPHISNAKAVDALNEVYEALEKHSLQGAID